MKNIKIGTVFGAIALILGAVADYFNGKQMEYEVRETVNEELDRRLNADNDNA